MNQAPNQSAPAQPQPGQTEEPNVSAMHAAIMREKTEPREGFEPISLWLIAFIGGLLFWGGFYLARFSADFNPTILDTRRPTEIVTAAPKAPPSPEVLGQRTFGTICVPCHQADGKGVPGQFPPLAGSEWVNHPSPDRVIRIILNGLQGPVTVSGQQFNNAMPPWRDNLSDDQIAAVATYVRNQWGNRAPGVKPDQVAPVRKQTQDRNAPWSAAELQAVTEAQQQRGASPQPNL